MCVVDDGLEWDNPDLRSNYNAAGSIDLNDHDNDPMPRENTGQRKSVSTDRRLERTVVGN